MYNKTKRVFGILFLCLIGSATIHAQNNKKIKVLFLGNSYTYVNNLPQLISDLALAKGDTLVFDSNCPGGATFNNHFTNGTSLSKINSQKWNYVVLQAQSQEPSFPPSQVGAQTLPYAVKLDSVIQQNDSCTITTFYETWGRKNGDASNCAAYPPLCTYTGMQNRLKQSYKLFADTCHALMAPAGEAWRSSISFSPALELYQADESHPSLEGSYLTACVFYEILFKKSVLSNTYTAGVATATASFLQQVAHAVVNDSLTVWNVGKYNPCALQSTVGIKTAQLKNGISLFPNPVKEVLNIVLPNDWGKEAVTYKITDVLGRTLMQDLLVVPVISVYDLPQGMYCIEVNAGTQRRMMKFNKE